MELEQTMTSDTITARMVAIAAVWASYFTHSKRADESEYTHLKDNAPSELADAVHAAHGDMLPDDFRYAMIEEAIDAVADAGEDADVSEVSSDYANEAVSIWNSERTKWLSSHLSRPGYVDEARDNLGDAGDIMKQIGWGWYTEAEEVFASVAESLEEAATAMQTQAIEDAKERGTDRGTEFANNIPDDELANAEAPSWLSGEWAGESISELLGDLLDGASDEDQSEIESAYEEAADEAFAGVVLVRNGAK